MTKRCFKCGDEKPLDDFYVHPMMADGHLNKCKDCTKVDVRRRRIVEADKVRGYDRERSKQPHRRQLAAERGRIYREQNGEKRKAHHAVNNAIRDGKLTRQPCAFCGGGENLEAHHHDYEKPLDVTWLCSGCHRRFHALEQMATYRENEAV